MKQSWNRWNRGKVSLKSRSNHNRKERGKLPLDTIEIRNLEIFAHHGVYEEEQHLGQKFVVSLKLGVDTSAAGKSDDLTQTMNYGAIARKVTRIVQEKNYQLLERVAAVIAEQLLLTEPLLQQVTVTVDKPWAPVGLPLETVGVTIARAWHTAYIGIGSNLGDRKAYTEHAVEGLRKHPQIRVETIADWIETEPYGVTDQPVFLNGCAKLRTTLSAHELLDVLQGLEQEAKRERIIHWGPRTLDLDLLFYDQEIIGTERLIVPHPEIEKREFVLQPLAQIAPWLRHPVSHLTVRQMLENLRGQE